MLLKRTLSLLSFAFIVSANAQDTSITPVSNNIFLEPVVKKVTAFKDTNSTAGLGEYIKVYVANLDTLVQKAKTDDKRIILFINNVPMRGIYAEYLPECDDAVIFLLSRDTVSSASWKIFYAYPMKNYSIPVKISVGLEGGKCIKSDAKPFTLILVQIGMLIGSVIGIVILLLAFYFLARYSDILRDETTNINASYSLSRSQLAFWTIIIVCSYVFIWAVTGELPHITGSTLILLAIGIGTTASASIIDSSDEKNKMTRHQNGTSGGFIMDILSDASGVNIQRFQLVVWTVVLGLFFIRSVFISLEMPQFDDTLLTLMGISNGTYVGLKIPENKSGGGGQAPTPAPPTGGGGQPATPTPAPAGS